MSQFFTNEAVSLEKGVDSVINKPTESELIDETYELKTCLEWIKSNEFEKVCLQFPDHLLQDSSEVALRLQKALGRNVYILADTAYESCCVDYVAANHVNADAIIHFGPVCFSKTSATIPYLNIYEKKWPDLDELHQTLTETHKNWDPNLVILLDTDFIHLQAKIAAKFDPIGVQTIDSGHLSLKDTTVVFIGGRNHHRKLPNLKFSHQPKNLYYFSQEQPPRLTNYETDEKILRRKAIERLKKLIALHNKKYYLVSVGKPTVAKLANFPEIDVYVVVTCALNEIYDSRDFYKPIVTIYDVEMALNPSDNGLGFTYDYNDVIARPIADVVVSDSSDVSLVTGKIRGGSNVSDHGEVMAKEAGTVVLSESHGAGFLAARSWKGLERDLGRGEVKLAEEGRRGIAQQYEEESAH
ncbi:hypothetical protein Zmor_000182 [Zophobas morio]|uniref:2-(3-amino-3-carboxypropyl)histidine synthase n=1 Tax=Zophobas morio TaxID=2755281 RepID=A0AA38MRA8_9CUCU|nr:hypothetical protein Zmor_000182 [Zophobas morio]